MITHRATILLPAFNAEKYIKCAIDSILTQTYVDFILLIINDGSTDTTEEIIKSYTDTRINYLKNDKNIGLAASLNRGLNLIETEYVVRMDADDISLPKRLEWQIDFMDKNPGIGVSGGLFEIIGNESGIPNIPLNDEDIKASLLFGCMICHPTVIMRSNLLKENAITYGVPFDFNDGYGHTILELEDYALWHKLKSITKFTTINKVLIKYRKEGQNLTQQKTELIFERKKKYYSYLLNEINIHPSENNLLIHISLKNISTVKSPHSIVDYKQYLAQIKNKNLITEVYPQQALEKMIEQQWYKLFFYLPSLGIKYVITYWKCGKIRWPHFTYYIKYKVNKIIGRKPPVKA